MTINIFLERLRDRGIFRYLIYALAILTIVFFLVRNSIVQIIFQNRCSGIKSRYGLNISAEKIGFSGLQNIYIENLYAKAGNRDTLFSINRAEVKLNFTDLLFLKVNPLDIWLSNPKINLVGEKGNSNYNFLVGSRIDSLQIQHSSVDEGNSNRQYAIYRLVKAVFGLTTAKYHVSNFLLSYSDSAYTTHISVPEFESNAKGFNTQIEVHENGEKYFINLNGLADKDKSDITLKAIMVGEKKSLPLLNHKFGFNISFDTLGLRILAKELSRENIHLEINSSVKSLDLFSQRLSDQTVKVRQGECYIDIAINSDYYLVDSTSTIVLNGLKAKLYLKYTPNNERSFEFKINTGVFQSQQLFDALPDGLFTNLKGIKTNGTIDYSLDFKVRLDNPDSMYLNPQLITRNFSLVQYGFRNFSALNDTFSHDVYDEGQYIRTIRIDPSNKSFKRLDEISPFIIDAVVTSEDGGFFTNQGFDLDAFKYAISENIKQKRYARGGSTITMQLVKNLYLSKNKNLFRKAEEYLIVWLIENQAIVAKERLLEIYLNIIEWGPNIYGISEACQYYFNKTPKDVTLDEALYLASIVPRPKKFKYLFEKDGNLKSFMEDDFKFISNKMLLRGMISENQFNDLTYNIRLNGQAKNMLVDTISTISDSISIDEVNIARDTALLLP